MSNTDAATEKQVTFLRSLMAECYTTEEIENNIAALTADRQTASRAIQQMLDAGYGDQPTEPKATVSTKATDKQIRYASRLISRIHWHDSDLGQYGPPPSTADLAKMSRREISALINDLRHEDY